MPQSKKYTTRSQQKRDIEANWKLAVNFVPLAGEIIVYEVDETHSAPRIKIGDGKTKINDLPFVSSESMLTFGKNSVAFGKGSLMSQEELKLGSISLGKISPSVIFANGDIPIGSTEFSFKITDRIAGVAIETWLDKFKDTPHNGMVLKIGNNLCPLYASDETFTINGNLLQGYSGTIKFMDGYATTEAIANGTHIEEIYMGAAMGEAAMATNVRTLALGDASFAEGRMTRTTKTADGAHAEGYMTSAEAEAAHAEGNTTVASGVASHAQNVGTIASGAHASAAGNKTRAGSANQFVVGKFNKNKTNTIFEVGNGTGEDGGEYNGQPTERSNAFEVYSDGHAEIQTQGTTENSVVTIKTVGAIADGLSEVNQKVTQVDEAVKALEPKVKETNMEKGVGYLSTKQICATGASGSRSTALGSGTSAEGYISTATGGNTTAKGDYSFTEGINTKAAGAASHAQGNGSTTGEDATNASAFGNGTTANYADQFVVGRMNQNKSSNIFEVGAGNQQAGNFNAFEVGVEGYTEPYAWACIGGKEIALKEDIKHLYKTVSGTLTNRVVEATNISSPSSVSIKSPVVDNYAYNENLLKMIDLVEEREIAQVANGATFRVTKIGLKTNAQAATDFSNITIDDTNFNRSDLPSHTAYILFTINNSNVSSSKYLIYSWATDNTSITGNSILIPIKELQKNHQYLLVIEFKYVNNKATLIYKYLLDQTEACHCISEQSVPSNFPIPNAIVAVDRGQLDSYHELKQLEVSWIANDYHPIPDWNVWDPTAPGYIENKTHGIVGKLYEVSLSDYYNSDTIKVSDDILTINDLNDCVITFIKEDNEYVTSLEELNVSESFNVGINYITIGTNLGGWTQDRLITIITSVDLSQIPSDMPQEEIPTTGIYFYYVEGSYPEHSGAGGGGTYDAYVTKLQLVEEIKQLDEKYLPDMKTINGESIFGEGNIEVSANLDSLNIKNSIGASSLQQNQDTKYTGIAIVDKNPTAAAHDSSLTNNEPIGAKGDFATSLGGASSAQGKRSVAEGTNTIAKGAYSHAEGDNSVTLGNDSHAEGYGTVAFGNASHAEGSGSVAFGLASHAGGASSTAAGDASFAHGTDTRAYGTHSSAFGNGTIATRDNSFVIGKFNIESDDLIFGIGCGYDNSARENALALYTEDQGRAGLHVYGERVATENQVSELTEELRTEVKNSYGRKAVSGEILEIKDLDNPFNATVDSTVTDNYFYKENYLKFKFTEPIDEPNILNGMSLGGTGKTEVNLTVVRSKFSDGFVNYNTAFIIFRTPADTSGYDTLYMITPNCKTSLPIKPLKANRQYMLIVNYGDYDYTAPFGAREATFSYLVDYEDSYHWVIGQDTAGIPCPYTIMIPHVGRIDKGDTLSVEYQCSEAAAVLNNVIASGSTLPDANDPSAPKFFVLI